MKKYYLYPQGIKIEVTQELYETFYKYARREKYLEERDEDKGLVSYHEIEQYQDEFGGEETISDKFAETTEDMAIKNVLIEKMHDAIRLLDDDEITLINAIFFKGYSYRAWAKITGLSHGKVQYRINKILQKLRTILEK